MAPQYAEFGEFGAFGRESRVIASLNSANGHQILYAREAGIIIAVTGTFGILFEGFPSWVSGWVPFEIGPPAHAGSPTLDEVIGRHTDQ